LTKISTEGEMGDIGRKTVHRLVKIKPKGEMGYVRWEVIYWLVKFTGEGEMSDTAWQVINSRMAKIVSKREPGNGGREKLK